MTGKDISGESYDREFESIGVYTVSQLTSAIKETLEITFDDIWVEGEISNARLHTSGHLYFSLKDEGAQIRAVAFKGIVAKLNFVPEDGMKVLCHGRLSVYESRGEYQIIVISMERKGVGELYIEFEKLKKKLMEEGLFAPERKRNLPFLPRRVGVVTSPTGAAIRDILKVMKRRFPNMEIFIVPVRVQGEGSAMEIADGIRTLSESGKVEVIIVGRGGGSIEDLWAFNEEIVARAIASSKVPVVSAVGHEIDYTISDFVADMRAPTPSAAAEMITRDRMELLDTIEGLTTRLRVSLLSRIRESIQKLQSVEKSLMARQPMKRVEDARIEVDDMERRCIDGFKRIIKERRRETETMRHSLFLLSPFDKVIESKMRLDRVIEELEGRMMRSLEERRRGVTTLTTLLNSLSPLQVLSRGYSITFRVKDGSILKEAEGVEAGDDLRTLLHRGELISTVKGRN